MEQMRESAFIPDEISRKNYVVIERVPAVTIRAPVTIEDIKINAVVDNGAEVTV